MERITRRLRRQFAATSFNRGIFTSIEWLEQELADDVHWFNCIRLHGTLGYLSPEEFQKANALSFLFE